MLYCAISFCDAKLPTCQVEVGYLEVLCFDRLAFKSAFATQADSWGKVVYEGFSNNYFHLNTSVGVCP